MQLSPCVFRCLVWPLGGRLVLGLALALSVAFSPRRAHAEPMREFIMSCTYGVLAGTLVGAATLAFTDKPGDNLNRVARGASIGLYAGMLLGFYVVYGVPDGETIEDDPALQGLHLMAPDGAAPVAAVHVSRNISWRASQAVESRLLIAPMFSERGGLEGAALQYHVARF